MNSELPAYQYTQIPTVTTVPLRFSIRALDVDYCIFETNTKQFPQLLPGVKVKVLDESLEPITEAFISKVTDSAVKCDFFSRLTPQQFASARFCELLRAWSIPEPQTLLIDDTIFVSPFTEVAVLNAECKVPNNHQAGLISWSLFYRTLETQSELNTEVIKSCDYGTYGVCSFSRPGRWKPGYYTLVTQRFDVDHGNIVGEDSKLWTLLEPTGRLSCGQYTDPHPALRL